MTTMPPQLAIALEAFGAQVRLGEGLRARLFRPVRGSNRIHFPERAQGDTSLRVLLSRDGRTATSLALNHVSLADLVMCHPMRTFSRRQGQTNKPVAYYSRTVGDLVACESQHERRFLMLADWHDDVVHIAAQPFTLEFPPGSELRSHTPDFALILRDGGVLVPDVKWPTDAIKEPVVRRHTIVRDVLARAGMQHVVWTDAPQAVTENLAFFAAARVPTGLLRDLAPRLTQGFRPGITVEALTTDVSRTHNLATMTLLVVLRRLLWDRVFRVDMLVPFTLRSELHMS